MSEVGDTVEIPIFDEGTVIEKIDKKDLKPMWGPHNHEFVDDPSDTTDEYYAQICVVEKCGVGRLIRKN